MKIQVLLTLMMGLFIPCAHAQTERLPDEIVKALQASFDDCSDVLGKSVEENFRISRRDLNGDSVPEIIVQGKNSCLCGATGNCSFAIFQGKKGRYVPLLESSLVQRWDVLAHRTHGFSDLRLSAHSSATESEVRELHFDGKRYRQYICEDWLYAELDERGNMREFKQPKKTRIACTNELDE